MVDNVISDKLKKIGVNLEYKATGDFPGFRARHRGEKIVILCDRNTRPFAEAFEIEGKKLCFFDEEEPVPDEKTCEKAVSAVRGCDYVLAAGSGTLNDTAKYAAKRIGKRSGVLATAPSMDGYASPVVPVIRAGVKISETARVPADILIDADILSAAPKKMIAAGVGDILGKYTALTDWRLAQYHSGEEVNEEAFSDMLAAVDKCFANIGDISAGGKEGIGTLTDALVISGLAMAEAGNSRPASGAEHHISHYLEMYFIAQKKPVSLHGINVGLGTLVSSYLYNALERDGVRFPGDKETYAAAKFIPSPEWSEETLKRMGAPVKFSALGIGREVFRSAIREAHTLRQRFTVLSLLEELRLTERYLPELEERFYA